MNRIVFTGFVIAFCLSTWVAPSAQADLPTADKWINSKPLDLNTLKGKLIVLEFYEET